MCCSSGRTSVADPARDCRLGRSTAHPRQTVGVPAAAARIARLAKTKRLHLRPLGVSQNESVHPQLESQPRPDENPESKQTLVDLKVVTNLSFTFPQLSVRRGRLAFDCYVRPDVNVLGVNLSPCSIGPARAALPPRTRGFLLTSSMNACVSPRLADPARFSTTRRSITSNTSLADDAPRAPVTSRYLSTRSAGRSGQARHAPPAMR